jgi:hypothetical protein
MVTYSYTGPVDYHAYNYGNYSGNAADLNNYLASGRGPYAQYQPVSVLNYSLDSSLANIEIFSIRTAQARPADRTTGQTPCQPF